MTRINGLSTKLAVLSASLMLMSASTINGALPYIKDQLGITQTQTELLSTLPNLSVVIFILLSSFIAEKIGIKTTVSIGLFLVGIGGSSPLFISQYSLLLLSRLLLGIGLGLFNSLAVSLISSLYEGNIRANLLGIRNSVESIGQSLLTMISGILLNIGWHYSFATYLFAFPLIFLFNIFVPEIQTKINEKDKNDVNQTKEKLNPEIYFLVIFAMISVMNIYAVTVRFSSIATEINGPGYNASNLLAMMPILGIIAGFLFGFIHKFFGDKMIYLGVIIFILVNLLIGFSNGNFFVLLSGLFLSGIPTAWCFPYIYNSLSKITHSEKSLNLSTSLILVGCNIGGFIAPLLMQLIQKVTNSNSLTAPFPIFALLFIFIFIIIVAKNRRISRVTEEESK